MSEKPFRKPGVLYCDPAEGRTRQEFTEDADIHRIMERFTRTGQLPVVTGNPIFADVSQVPSLQEAHALMGLANQLFFDQPAQVRVLWDNDPVKMFDWLRNPDNREQAVKLGLMKPAEAPKVSAPTPAESGKEAKA